MTWGTAEERETHLRVRVSLAAYAYEMVSNPIMSDAQYDDLAQRINPRQMTGHPVFDEFFLVCFDPFTGMWVRNHPDLPGLRRTYLRLRAAGLLGSLTNEVRVP